MALDELREPDGRLRVLLVFKRTRLEFYRERLSPERVEELPELQIAHEVHQASLAKIKSILQKYKAHVHEVFRGDLAKVDESNHLVITVGGDGTLLEAAQYAKNNPVLGINSDPERSVGSLCATDSKGFEDYFRQIDSGKIKPITIARGICILDGEEIPHLALNDVLVAHQIPASTSRYVIEIDGRAELQKSSGIWIAAPLGSTGAILSAGGQVQPLNDNRLQFRVREPYFVNDNKPQILGGFIEPNQSLRIQSRMAGGTLFIDGPHFRVPFPLGSKLEIHAGGAPLYLFVSPDIENERNKLAEPRRKHHDQRR